LAASNQKTIKKGKIFDSHTNGVYYWCMKGEEHVQGTNKQKTNQGSKELLNQYDVGEQKKSDPNQRYICNDDNINKFIDNARDWREKNPKGEVNIWYDSKLISQNSVANTKELLQSSGIAQGVNLKDIRDIDIVKYNPDVF